MITRLLGGGPAWYHAASCQSKYSTDFNNTTYLYNIVNGAATVKGDIEDQSALHFLAGWFSKISKKVTRLLGGGPAWHHAASCQSKYSTDFNNTTYIYYLYNIVNGAATVKGDIEDQSALHFLASWFSKVSKKVTRLLGGGPAWHHAASCQSKYSTDFNDTSYIYILI